ncbi:DUF6585 family protein [Streptomyces sp. NPDC018833]|uniref:DUF6585 family protein n=1 Tax=Streptomyces sp. NPDC018833 TaxID=3365053 RepID=UPI00378B9E6A
MEGTPRDRDEELLLARISEAAGRWQLGRRRATHRAVPHGVTAQGWGAAIQVVSRAAAAGARRLRRPSGRKRVNAGARLDFFEHGITAAVNGRIHVIRYDTTVVRRCTALSPQGITRTCVLIDVDGERIVLRGGDFGHAEVWEPELRRAVTDAQVPRALAALAQGARLTFGPVWITEDEVGSGRTSMRWPQVQRIDTRHGSATVRVAGRWQSLGTVASGIPNVFVFHALAEHLAGIRPPGAERSDE